ncbi:hypothetical protein SCG7109_AI_00180 [Chlamydiales bacterium SCGC AG-110-M15]|nr:hypothetical protein SCG7109_AI_00180 [Chlamydiales bacterium SCGC AG-110-M15]
MGGIRASSTKLGILGNKYGKLHRELQLFRNKKIKTPKVSEIQIELKKLNIETDKVIAELAPTIMDKGSKEDLEDLQYLKRNIRRVYNEVWGSKNQSLAERHTGVAHSYFSAANLTGLVSKKLLNDGVLTLNDPTILADDKIFQKFNEDLDRFIEVINSTPDLEGRKNCFLILKNIFSEMYDLDTLSRVLEHKLRAQGQLPKHVEEMQAFLGKLKQIDILLLGGGALEEGGDCAGLFHKLGYVRTPEIKVEIEALKIEMEEKAEEEKRLTEEKQLEEEALLEKQAEMQRRKAEDRRRREIEFTTPISLDLKLIDTKLSPTELGSKAYVPKGFTLYINHASTVDDKSKIKLEELRRLQDKMDQIEKANLDMQELVDMKKGGTTQSSLFAKKKYGHIDVAVLATLRLTLQEHLATLEKPSQSSLKGKKGGSLFRAAGRHVAKTKKMEGVVGAAVQQEQRLIIKDLIQRLETLEFKNATAVKLSQMSPAKQVKFYKEQITQPWNHCKKLLDRRKQILGRNKGTLSDAENLSCDRILASINRELLLIQENLGYIKNLLGEGIQKDKNLERFLVATQEFCLEILQQEYRLSDYEESLWERGQGPEGLDKGSLVHMKYLFNEFLAYGHKGVFVQAPPGTSEAKPLVENKRQFQSAMNWFEDLHSLFRGGV